MTLRKYILEIGGTKKINFDDLNDDTKMDIISQVYHESEHSEYLSTWNIWTFREYIEDALDLPKDFTIEFKEVDKLYLDFKRQSRSVSRRQVENLKEILIEIGDLDPIIVLDGKFFDGGHRLIAYKESNRKEIPTIEIKDFFNVNWEKFMEGEEI